MQLSCTNGGNRFLLGVLEKFCTQRNIELRVSAQGWLASLRRAEQRHFIFGYDIGLNRSAAHQIADDKCATHDVLRAANIPSVEHVIFHHPTLEGYVDAGGNWEKILAYFRRAHEDVVCKPVSGTAGTDVIRAQTVLALETSVQALFDRYRSICLSPFLDIASEYRAIVLDGQCLVTFEKIRPSSEGRLTEWRHNLSLGCTPELLPDSARRRMINALATTTLQSMGLRFASVDIIDAGQLKALEVNPNVMMERFAQHSDQTKDIAEAIYTAALATVFD